jgi:hypothetical protein
MLRITLKTALLILIGNLAGCAVEHSVTLVPIKSMPKGKAQSKRKYNVVMVTGARRTRNIIEVYDIGSTVNDSGDLVGQHQLFRVVESSHWVLASKVKTPILPIPAPTPPARHSEPDSRKETAENPLKPGPQTPIDNNNALAGGQQQPDSSSVIPDNPALATPEERQALTDFNNANPANATPAPTP